MAGGGVSELDDTLELGATSPGSDGGASLVPGKLFAERFELVGLAGSGGMGSVYRARDRQTGSDVALKILHGSASSDRLRFGREAQLLADLAHPAIVRYLAHGSSHDGTPFIAMEWLEGEDLAERLRRCPLTVAESLAIVRRAAGALAAAHARGIVHRDIKPGNLLLVDREPERTKLLDFGIARPAEPSALTRTNVVLGTPAYIAPEQALDFREVDARADLFSLGCILFECLVGRQPFVATQPVAVLAKIMLEDAPRLLSVREDLPPALDALVASLLAKEPACRPQDAAAVVSQIDALGDAIHGPGPAVSQSRQALTTGEKRFLSVVLVGPLFAEPADPAQVNRALGALRELARSHRGQLMTVPDGSVLVVLKSEAAADRSTTSQAVRAARCCLAILRLFPRATIALASGHAEVEGDSWPVGPVVERAAQALETGDQRQLEGVAIDAVSAGLLEGRFRLATEGPATLLLEERADEGARRLLGKATRCVGRARELAFLEGIFGECCSEGEAQVVLVVGAPGVGKTRLRHELIDRIRCTTDATVLVARGDPVYAGSAQAMAAQLVRHAAAQATASRIDTFEALTQGLSRQVGAEALERVAEFLGELPGLPASDSPSRRLRAARDEALVMTDQLTRAFVEWIDALCARRPFLLVLEDLHWGDEASIAFVSEAVQELRDRPLMVMAMARPEVEQVFPRLWSGLDLQRLYVAPLRRKAAEQLVTDVLGDDCSSEAVARIVARAEGNAFYLEELIRHEAAGSAATLPETVIAMAQSRLESLEPEGRRLLRSAAIFGDRFSADAVCALLGDGSAEGVEADLHDWFDALVDREFITPLRGEHSDRDFAFRHGLLRDAAYAALTEHDRKLGHRLAAEWLERAGEPNALALAEHLVQADLPTRAAVHYLSAALAAFRGGSVALAHELAERGIKCGAEDETRGGLLLLQGEGLGWGGNHAAILQPAEEALHLLPVESTRWFTALSLYAWAVVFGDHPEHIEPALDAVRSFRRELRPSGPEGLAVFRLGCALFHLGEHEPALDLLRRVERAIEKTPGQDLVFEGYGMCMRMKAGFLGWIDREEAVPAGRAAIERFSAAEDSLGLAVAHHHLGFALLDRPAGRLGEAFEEATKAIEGARRTIGARFSELWGHYVCGAVDAAAGRIEALDHLDPVVRTADRILGSLAMTAVAMLHLQREDLEEAERWASRAVTASEHRPIAHANALVVAAGISLLRGRLADAAAQADRGLRAFALSGGLAVVEKRLQQIRAAATAGESAS
jgi:tetratricopeptide (TPR) repeat protein